MRARPTAALTASLFYSASVAVSSQPQPTPVPTATPTCTADPDSHEEPAPPEEEEAVVWLNHKLPPCAWPPEPHRVYSTTVIMEATLAAGRLANIKFLRLPRIEPPYPTFEAEIRSALSRWRYKPNPRFVGAVPKTLTMSITHCPH